MRKRSSETTSLCVFFVCFLLCLQQGQAGFIYAVEICNIVSEVAACFHFCSRNLPETA